MKFKIKSKFNDLKIGDVLELHGNAYKVTEFKKNDDGEMRVYGKRLDSDRLFHLFGLPYYKEHIMKGRVKLLHHVQD